MEATLLKLIVGRPTRHHLRLLEGYAAARAADEAIAADACRASVPDDASCFICLSGSGDETQGDLVRGCLCRGTSGFVHVRCLVAMAESKAHDSDYQSVLFKCGQCRQEFTGPVNVALARARRLHFAGRAEDEYRRNLANEHMGVALSNAERFEESLSVKAEEVATMRRMYGPNALRTIEAEERVAITLWRRGGDEDLRSAHETLTRVYEWKTQHCPEKDKLETGVFLGNVKEDLGMLVEATALRRAALEWRLLYFGEANEDVLGGAYMLSRGLYHQGTQGEVVEAREIVSRMLPVSMRVLGPHHEYTGLFQRLLAKLSDETDEGSGEASPPAKRARAE